MRLYLEYLIDVLPKPNKNNFSYATRSELGGGGQDGVHAHPQDLAQMAPPGQGPAQIDLIKLFSPIRPSGGLKGEEK